MISSKLNSGKCQIKLRGDYNSLLKEYVGVGMAMIYGAVESAPDPVESLTALADSLGNVIEAILEQLEDMKEEGK